MRVLLLFTFTLCFGCTQPGEEAASDNNVATLECLLDAYLAELPPAKGEALWVHEGVGWTDSSSLMMVSAYDLDYLDRELARDKQAAFYRGRQVIYSAARIGFPKAKVTAGLLLSSELTWAPVDTSSLLPTVMLPPYDPPVAQVVYNHERQLFEDVLLVTSAMDIPGCSKAK